MPTPEGDEMPIKALHQVSDAHNTLAAAAACSRREQLGAERQRVNDEGVPSA